MYCSFTKSQAFPLVLRVSSRPRFFKTSLSFKTQSFPDGFHPNLPESCNGIDFRNLSHGFEQVTHGNVHVVKSRKSSTGVYQKTQDNSNRVKPRNFSNGLHLRSTLGSAPVMGARNFSNVSGQIAVEGNREVRAGKPLPWIAEYKSKGVKRSEKVQIAKTTRSSWEESANSFFQKNGLKSPVENRETKNRTVDMPESRRSTSRERNIGRESEEEEAEIVDDPRWDKIKSRYRRITDVEFGSEKPEVRRWNKQENWGRKTMKEAIASTVPKMVGEGIYGVGPVLASLSAGRREFYTLYVQEGLDLSSNNRKKKDKKGFEKVLRIAEKIGLTKKEVSRHDLNMIVDNRPHQGLVLDASPLEMVSIRELDPVLVEGEKGPLWVALDEVTDPQNLGAIIRSTYFFGAAGVVVCAKNSAPLSGVVSKASAGSLELMELRYCKNMMQFLASSAENGWRVLGGSVSSRALPLNEILPGAPTILVLGSEGTGLRPLVERSCTHLIRIPGNIPVDISSGGVEDVEPVEVDRGCSGEEFRSFLAVESLNVSVAAGVLLHHLVGNNNNCHIGDTQTNALE
ncbi:hypothetical protein HHK36_006228 [Tetracentron sinense]|uniref:rRNA methyltransferase 1, mitochondrial n=1 Tax=Tetracentron sinense TaxID=13715 RepID=A0A835DK15_TETSI|nr:hypothetical protein HHK36_006228 [Tetracentron sinense]